MGLVGGHCGVKAGVRRTLGVCLVTAAAWASMGASCNQKQRNPTASMNRYRIAVDEFSKKELPAAQKDLEAALQYDPENTDAHNLLGLIYVQRGVDNLYLAERRSCERGSLGGSLRREAQGFFTEAGKHFKRALKVRKDYAEAYNNLATVAIQLGDYQGAVKYANEALAFAPRLTRVDTARANLGWAYYYLKDYVRAERELLQATSHDPTFCLGAYRLAKVYADQSRPDRAVETLEALMNEQGCPIVEAHYLLGVALVKERQAGRARQWFQSCATLEPGSCLADECRQSLANLPPASDEGEDEQGFDEDDVHNGG